jgi:hypothetical protein
LQVRVQIRRHAQFRVTEQQGHFDELADAQQQIRRTRKGEPTLAPPMQADCN